MSAREPAAGPSLADFRNQVEALLAAPADEGEAAVLPTLFPPGQAPDLLVFVGACHPGQLRAIRAQLPERSFLLFFYTGAPADSDEVLRAAARGRTLACPLEPEAACREKLAFLIARLPKRQVRLVLDPSVEGRLGSWPRDLRDTIVFTLDNCQQDRTRGLIRLRCSIANLPAIAANRGLRLRPVPAGTDAIICGAGPSLESQLDLLRQAQGRVLLLAVGHAVPALTRAGIRPHVVVEVDSQADRNWPEEVRPDSLLAAAAEVAPAVAARFRRVLWFAGSSPAFSVGLAAWGIRLPELALARTVTASAVDLAIRFGCRRVALVGQDLCLGPGGQTHAGRPAAGDAEETLALPGNEGGTVRASPDLAEVREALQGFLRAVARAFAGRSPAPLILNCTRGGALIEGVGRLGLEEFLAGLDPRPLPDELAEVGPASDLSPAAVAGAAQDLEQLASLAAGTASVARRFQEQLAAGAGPGVLARAQAEVQEALAREAAFSAAETRAAWIEPLVSFGNGIAGERLGPAGAPGPDAEFGRIEQRSLLLQDVSREFAADLAAASAAMVPAAGGAGSPRPETFRSGQARNPHAFLSFRRLAVRCLEPDNPELAAWLARQPFPAEAPADRFQVRWRNQVAPYAKVRAPGGDWLALTSFGDVSGQARADVDRWALRERFEPGRQAVLFLAPGAWLHVLEFSRRFPAAAVAVLEPWLDWLAALCDHGCLVHALPPGALVAACDGRVPGWRPLLEARLRQWRESGLLLRLFPHPRAGSLPEVAAWTREFAGH